MSENSISLAKIEEWFHQFIKDMFNLIIEDENFSELKTEIYDSEESKSTKMVMELSRMHRALADQNEHLVKEVSKNTHKSKTPIKSQHVDSYASTSPQVTQTSKKHEFMMRVDFEVSFSSNGGSFRISRREGSEFSVSRSSDSKTDSLTSINKNLNSPVKNFVWKVKETKVHDPEVLLKKISNLEKEQLSLKKKIQDLTDENALLEAEKANVAELKLMISESNRKTETMGKVIEASRKQVLTEEDEISKLKQELSKKDLDSQIMSENVEGFQQYIKELLNLFEQDEIFSEITPEIYDSKKSKLTKLVTELSHMYGALADQHVHSIKEVSKNTHISTTPIKTQHVSSSYSTSPQVNQRSTTPNFMTPVGFDVIVNLSEGGFLLSRREGSESSITSSSDSEPIKKHLDSPVNTSKVKKTSVHDPEVLLKKISNFEKEQLSLKKKIQELTDENALLEAEKANVTELKLMISESNLEIETMGKVIEASRKQVITAEDEISKLKQELSKKDLDSQIMSENVEGFQQYINEILQKISNFEKEELSLKKKIRDLTDENALLEAEKANVAGLKLIISESNCKIETMEKVIEASRKQVLTAEDEISKLKQELSKKDLDSQIMSENVEGFQRYIKELLKKISNFEKEQLSLKKKIHDLTDENALLGAEKANVADLKLMISESNRKIEIMKKALEGSRKQVITAEDEISKLKQELSKKDLDQNHFLSVEQSIASLEKQLDSRQARVLELSENVIRFTADITKRDDEIKELNTKIVLMRISHAADEDRWNADIDRLKTKLREKQFDEEEARNPKLTEQVALGLAEIAKRDEQIKELNTQIDLLKNSHAAEEDKWNSDIERLRSELREKCELIDDLNQKHDAVMSYTDELKLKVEEWEREVDTQREVMSEEKREVIRQLSFAVEHYMSACKQLRQSLLGYKRHAVLTSRILAQCQWMCGFLLPKYKE